ncbi:unnamed protein product [Lactuca saligna]|uniref:Uncharacterized protein n=1 Tax=Lactuca saligna TaxID=75948 RepID=A0AA35YXY3_LACSI|nr:unnamed protein product [Lactuca saligna]
MEPNNSINQIDNHIGDDGDQNSIPSHHHQIITYLRKRKHSQSQVITPINSTQVNPLSKSSVLGLVLIAHTFSYDIQNLAESLLLEILARLPLKSKGSFYGSFQDGSALCNVSLPWLTSSTNDLDSSLLAGELGITLPRQRLPQMLKFPRYYKIVIDLCKDGKFIHTWYPREGVLGTFSCSRLIGSIDIVAGRQVSGLWMLYKADTRGEGLLSASLKGFTVNDDREGTEENLRLAVVAEFFVPTIHGMQSNEVDETSLYVVDALVLDKTVFSQTDEVLILSPQRPLVVEVELCCYKTEKDK